MNLAFSFSVLVIFFTVPTLDIAVGSFLQLRVSSFVVSSSTNSDLLRCSIIASTPLLVLLAGNSFQIVVFFQLIFAGVCSSTCLGVAGFLCFSFS